MMKTWTWLEGKKTYLIAIFAGLVAALHSQGVEVPPYVYAFLGSVGLGFLRHAISVDTDKRVADAPPKSSQAP